jgi:glutamate/tyrosine decarboxylase-like PLP-dependent enzyme
MYHRLTGDLADLGSLLEASRSFAEQALGRLETRDVAMLANEETSYPLPRDGAGGRAALEEFASRWEPSFSGSAGPRYLGYVTGGTTPAALVGDWLTPVFDQNVVSGGDSSASALERETVGWVRELLGLDATHCGAFVTGATMSNFVGLAIAREWVGEQHGVSIARSGIAALEPVTVLSGAPHSSIAKALSMLGLGRDRLRLVTTLPGREAVDVEKLRAELDRLDGAAAIVIANAGTVNTADFDDLRAIAMLRRDYRFWLHVDAAFGGFAALSDTTDHLVAGLGEADSICVDLHKWLNVPYDAAVQFTRRRDLQLAVFQNSAAYLGDVTGVPDFLHLTPENSRRLRALPAWFSLVAYGREGHGEIVDRNIACARLLGAQLAAVDEVRLLAPVRLNVVCFTLADRPTTQRIEAVAHAIAESGRSFVTPTVYGGIPALRAAFSNWRTTATDVKIVVEAVREACAP